MSHISATSFVSTRLLLALPLLVGCGQDFMIHPSDKIVIGQDTGTFLEDDETYPEDTGVEEAPAEADEDGTGSTVPDDEPAPEPEDDTEEEPEPEADPAPEDDCTETSDLIYVLDKDSEALFIFDPVSTNLTSLGTLDCDSWGTPASMGVARDGYAYVRFSDQEVFQVDLNTLDCTSTSYSNGSTGFGSFGMGFATPTSSTWRDQLFVANSGQLALLNPTSWQLTTLGTLPSQAELTGTGAGELFGVLPLESPLTVVELDQSSGSVLDTIRVGTTLDIGNLDTFAFAAWDGSFYLFTRTYGMGSTTAVDRIERDGSITSLVSELGINVVGAGVSTCAPS